MHCPKSAPQPINGFFYPSNRAAGAVLLSQFSGFERGDWLTIVKNFGIKPQTAAVGLVCAPRALAVRYLWPSALTAPPNSPTGGGGACPLVARYAVTGMFGPPASVSTGDLGFIGQALRGAAREPRRGERLALVA